GDEPYKNCRFVKQIGRKRKKEFGEGRASSEGAWGGRCSDFGRQLAACQSRRGTRSGGWHRTCAGLPDGCAPPSHCAAAYTALSACAVFPAAPPPLQTASAIPSGCW